jgi:PEP-CTERM motif
MLSLANIRICLVTLFASCLLMLAPSTLHADTFTYDVTLTPNPGSLFGGSGSFTVDSAPLPSGVTNYGAGQIENLSFLIDGQTFTLAGDSNTTIQFVNGTLTDITFAEQVGTSPNRLDLQTSGVYAFFYNNELSESSGTFTAALASNASPVPEPPTLALLSTGILGLAGATRRKFLSHL